MRALLQRGNENAMARAKELAGAAEAEEEAEEAAEAQHDPEVLVIGSDFGKGMWVQVIKDLSHGQIVSCIKDPHRERGEAEEEAFVVTMKTAAGDELDINHSPKPKPNPSPSPSPSSGPSPSPSPDPDPDH